MSENLIISIHLSRKEKYEALLPQLESLLQSEDDLIANLANATAALKETFGFFWIGFYFVKVLSPTRSPSTNAQDKLGEGDKKELVLGPFQGTVACTRIAFGKGVCGTSWKEQKIIIVDDVEKFPGHIACSALSKSEIVLPVFKNNEVVMVLDVDSDKLSDFSDTDAVGLQKIITLIEKKL